MASIPEAEVDGERFEAYFHASPDAVLSVDTSGNIVRANDRVLEMFGYEPSELEGKPVELLVPEEDRDGHVDKRDAYLSAPESRPMGAGLDLLAVRKDGSTFPVDISLSPVEVGGTLEVMAAIRDRSEHEEVRRTYQALLEAAPDAVFVGDVETGEIIEVNEQAARLMNTSKAALVGRHQSDLHPTGEEERYRELFQTYIRSGRGVATKFPDGSDVFVETSDGEHVVVEISARVTEVNDRKVIVGLFRDISKRKAYERDLERQLDRLEAIARILSHDLRNPLTVAKGRVDLALQTGDVEQLPEVKAMHDRIEEIVDDTLTMVRNGYAVDSVEPIELDVIARESWGNVSTPDATLEIGRDAVVHADSSRLKHLFENLFRNAVEHGSADVTVRVGVLDNGFYVEDDGPGIPESDRETVFDLGFSTTTSGTGLGLNIVADVVTSHGWTVEAGASAEGGARFEVGGVTVESSE